MIFVNKIPPSYSLYCFEIAFLFWLRLHFLKALRILQNFRFCRAVFLFFFFNKNRPSNERGAQSLMHTQHVQIKTFAKQTIIIRLWLVIAQTTAASGENKNIQSSHSVLERTSQQKRDDILTAFMRYCFQFGHDSSMGMEMKALARFRYTLATFDSVMFGKQ